jgi:hypothetical protein
MPGPVVPLPGDGAAGDAGQAGSRAGGGRAWCAGQAHGPADVLRSRGTSSMSYRFRPPCGHVRIRRGAPQHPAAHEEGDADEPVEHQQGPCHPACLGAARGPVEQVRGRARRVGGRVVRHLVAWCRPQDQLGGAGHQQGHPHVHEDQHERAADGPVRPCVHSVDADVLRYAVRQVRVANPAPNAHRGEENGAGEQPQPEGGGEHHGVDLPTWVRS